MDRKMRTQNVILGAQSENNELNWRDVSVAKKVFCFCRGPVFGFQHPYELDFPLVSRNSSSLVPNTLFWPLLAPSFMCTYPYMHAPAGGWPLSHTHTHEKRRGGGGEGKGERRRKGGRERQSTVLSTLDSLSNSTHRGLVIQSEAETILPKCH